MARYAQDEPILHRSEGGGQRKLILLIAAVILALIAVPMTYMLAEDLSAGEVMVVQSVTGDLTWHTTPGPKWQGFGNVTKYRIRDQFWFQKTKDEDGGEPIKIRFNDGAHADLSGSIAWEMPIDQKSLTEIHRRYGSQHALEKQLIQTVVEKSVYMTGPLMSSSESYAARRNELIGYISDQIVRGVYKTESFDEKTVDPLTRESKTVKVVRLIKKGADFEREEKSPLDEFNIKTYNLAIKEVKYEPAVESQIQKLQQAAVAVQQAIAEAKTAEQRAITAKKEAEAEGAKLEGAANAQKAQNVAKAEAELIVQVLSATKEKTNAVIQAQQQYEVAELAVKTATAKKQEQELLGAGEAARKKLVLDADGALEQKLEAYVAVNKAYAESLAKFQGSIVPQVVMSGSGSGGTAANGYQNLMDLLTIRTAKELALDTSMTNAVKRH